MKTYQFRIKDSSVKKKLNKIASKVNYVWNYCVDLQRQVRQAKLNGRKVKYFSKYDLQSMVAGSSKELELNSAIIQLTVHRFSDSCLQFKKIVKFRSYKKNLGFIPFDNRCFKIQGDTIKINGMIIKFWNSREILGKVKCGSLACDSLGNWFVNITTDFEPELYCGDNEVGIDLGSKDLATLSNGVKYDNPKYYRKLEAKLGKAQKANKKKQVKKISKKIANQRKDYIHKMTTEITNNNKLIVVGDISSKKLTKTKMAKSVNDAGWFLIKTLLKYKAIERGAVCLVVNERNTTRTCHVCGSISDNSPKGIAGLKIREWKCDCGAILNRDVNAAINILGIGRDTLRNKTTKVV